MSVLLIETRGEVKLNEGDMWVYSIAVYGFFSCGISVISGLEINFFVREPAGD